MSHTSRATVAPTPAGRHAHGRFEDALCDGMQRTPWLALWARMPGINTDFAPERGEAMTAVALLSRSLLGQVPRALGGDSQTMERHADLSRKRLPALSDDARGPDLDDWDYGSSALHPMGGASHWEPWRRALEGALPAAQRVDGARRVPGTPMGPGARSAVASIRPRSPCSRSRCPTATRAWSARVRPSRAGRASDRRGA